MLVVYVFWVVARSSFCLGPWERGNGRRRRNKKREGKTSKKGTRNHSAPLAHALVHACTRAHVPMTYDQYIATTRNTISRPRCWRLKRGPELSCCVSVRFFYPTLLYSTVLSWFSELVLLEGKEEKKRGMIILGGGSERLWLPIWLGCS